MPIKENSSQEQCSRVTTILLSPVDHLKLHKGRPLPSPSFQFEPCATSGPCKWMQQIKSKVRKEKTAGYLATVKRPTLAMKHCLNLCKTQSCFILAVNNCCQIIACWFPRGEYFTYVPPPDPDFQLSFTVSQVVWTVDLRRSHLNQTLIFLVDFHLLQATKWSTRLPQTYLITTFSLSIFSSQF